VPSRRPPPGKPRPKQAAGPARGRTARGLEREVARLEAALDAERRRHVRQLETVRRAADRQLTAVVKEIAALRHHEARAEELARRLAECEARLGGGRDRGVNDGSSTGSGHTLDKGPGRGGPSGGPLAKRPR
jgi:ribosomal protein L16/L10AE